jgi:amidase
MKKRSERGSRVNRRKFLRTGVAGAAAALVWNSRAAGVLASAAADERVAEATIAELQQWMTAGRMSAKRIAEEYLERIEELDRRGPSVNSVIETNPDALRLAEEMDRERKAGKMRGALHGVPILIKDNIDTADRMKTTAGSLALLNARPQRDAFIVERLRAAGAVILGKTNLSEWANFRSTRSSSGWSGRGGQTRNPYALDRNPCGSSSGSGAAVAAGLAAAAVGTETDGSIVCPSSACGLVGIKPTLGLVSRSGIIPISHSQDTAGPMARTVADAALLLGALVGYDPRDPSPVHRTLPPFHTQHALATAHLPPAALRGARIGVARKFFGFNEKVDKLMADALDAMKREGATIVDPADLPTHGQFDAPEFEVLLYEFKADLNRYLASLAPGGDHPRTLKELIEFNEKNREREMPYFGQELFIRSEAKGPLTERAYRTALANSKLLSQARGIDAVMRRHRLDALVAPTGGPAWTTDLVNGDHFSGGSSTPAAVAGYPNVTVPAGFVHGLPVGISFFGRALTDAKLIRLAHAFEQSTKHRRPPKLN